MTPLDAALAAIDRRCGDPVIRAKLRGLMRGYDARWQDQPLNVVGIEQTVTSELWNPSLKAKKSKSRTFTLAGKLDLHLLEAGDRHWICDHKTTSEDIGDPNSPYWRQLIVESQHEHYALLEYLNGRKIEGAIWDVVKKPGISPKQIAKADQTSIFVSGYYFGFPVSAADADSVRADGRETANLYEYRLANDCMSLRPDWYFQRRRIARSDARTLEYAEELWGHGQDILYARNTKPKPRWPRNSGACMNYGRPCQYLGICSGYDEPDSNNWQRRAWVHPELPVLTKDTGINILTNSRIRCFQTCRRKHFYQYELGIERLAEDEAEALYFGTEWHEAMAVYFSTPGEETNDIGITGEQANEVGYTGETSSSVPSLSR